MRGVGGVATGFDLKRYSQCPLTLLVFHEDLNSGIDVSFQTIGWRPDMLLDIKKLGDTEPDFLATSVFS